MRPPTPPSPRRPAGREGCASLNAGARAGIAAPAGCPPPIEALVGHRALIDRLHQLARQLTGGDFESLVIWSELAHQSLGRPDPAPCDPQPDACQGAPPLRTPPDARPVSLSALVAATAIPRETVRRKLERLAQAGQAQRRGGGWVIAAAARRAPLDPRAASTPPARAV